MSGKQTKKGSAKTSDPLEALRRRVVVLFLLRNLMGWQWSGHGEKVRWSVYGSVNGEPVGFALRKFGFTILRAGEGRRTPGYEGALWTVAGGRFEALGGASSVEAEVTMTPELTTGPSLGLPVGQQPTLVCEKVDHSRRWMESNLRLLLFSPRDCFDRSS